MPRKKYDHSKISITSGIQYLRTFTDIPYAKEIFRESLKKKDRGLDFYQNRKNIGGLLKRTPYFEARFKMTNKIIKESKIKNILEIAAGFSPRSIIMTADPDIQYIETDLPQTIKKKKEIIQKILSPVGLKKRKNLRLQAANALDFKDMQKAASKLPDKPICIINEGLLRYLTFSERKKLAKNIYAILKKRGGIWITTDTMSGFSKKMIGSLSKNIEKNTGRSIEKYAFRTEKETEKFFVKLGFSIKKYPYAKIIKELSSPKKLKLNKKEVQQLFKSRTVFALTINK